MAPKSVACVRARAEFIRSALDEVRAENNPNDFRRNAYYAIAKLALHIRAEQEGLFEEVEKKRTKRQKIVF